MVSSVASPGSAGAALAFDASGDRVQRDSFKYNHFSPGVSYRFGSRDVTLQFRYDRIDTDARDPASRDRYQKNREWQHNERNDAGEYVVFPHLCPHYEASLRVPSSCPLYSPVSAT